VSAGSAWRSPGCVVGMTKAPWLRTGDASWRNPVSASRLSGLSAEMLRTLAKEELLTTLPVRRKGARHRYRTDELLALREPGRS
jgi:hypothetical protein